MPRRLVNLAAVVGLVGGLVAWSSPGQFVATAAPGASGPSTQSRSISRYHVAADGKKTTIDQRTVSVTVAQTTALRSLQLVNVSWAGAHPTGGIVGDPNSDKSLNEEYPMVLLECRGVDSTSVPAAQRLSPQTCWTQFSDERFFGTTDAYPAWRSDAEATPAERASVVNSPSAAELGSTRCSARLQGVLAQHWTPFIGADGTAFNGGPQGCAGLAPESAASNNSSLALPSNETFGVTALQGTGEANFDIFTAEDHASLGCSQTVACSLVAVPVNGISCDPTGALAPGADQPSVDDVDDATSNCETNGNFRPGSRLLGNESGQSAVDGRLWWSQSNWENRMSFPLTFAQPDNVCSLTDSRTPVSVYGSELLIQATTQWAPHFCLDPKLFNFNHVQTPEPQARNVLAAGNVEAAFSSAPPDTAFSKPTVQAPTAISGFGIAFSIDDANLKQVTHLNLNARLLAKLLTLSYPDITDVKLGYKALSNNPLNMSFDPEFQALNPGIPPQKAIDGAATLLTVNTDSDLVHALSSYVNADPEARSWLNGTPDPWGMVVNPNYKGISLPVDNWPVNDTFEPTALYQPGLNDCLAADPVPYLPLVATPIARLVSVGQDVQFAISQSQTICSLPSPIPGDTSGAKMVAAGRQPVGFRFMLGTVSLGDARREGLTLASLQTSSSVDPNTKITDASGRTFVTPDDSSLAKATALFRPDTAKGVWSLPYDQLATNAVDSGAYPGTMLVYTDVPTAGLPKADATDLAELLRFVAADGQNPGTTPGKLPAGFLPMTAANGAGPFLAYTNAAANAVEAQNGFVPTPGKTTTPPPSTTGSGGSATTGDTGSTGGLPSTTPTGPTGPSLATGALNPSGKTPNSGTAPSKSLTPVADRVPTRRFTAGVGGVVLPIMVIACACSIGASIWLRLRQSKPTR